MTGPFVLSISIFLVKIGNRNEGCLSSVSDFLKIILKGSCLLILKEKGKEAGRPGGSESSVPRLSWKPNVVNFF